MQEFAQWRAINEKQRGRSRDLARRSTIQKYKGNWQYYFKYAFIHMFSVLSRYLPPDVILIPEYDPSVDMDEKCKQMGPVNIDAIVKRVKASGIGTSKIRRQSTPVPADHSAVLESPPSSPESPAFEMEVPPDAVVKGGAPLRSAGPVIRG